MSENRDEFIRKRVERQKRIRKRRLKFLFVFLIILALLIGILLSLTVFFKIEKVNASGSKIYAPSQIIEAADIGNDENLFLISKAATLDKIKEKLPFIEDIEFSKSLPNEIEIIAKDAVEFYSISRGGYEYKVSTSNIILEKKIYIDSYLIKVIGCGFEGEVGDKIKFENPRDGELINLIIEECDKKKVSLQFIDFSNRTNLKLGVENKFDIKLGIKVNIKEKLAHLFTSLKEFSDEESGTIDLSLWTKEDKQAYFTPQKK